MPSNVNTFSPEIIYYCDTMLARIVRSSKVPDCTNFFSKLSDNVQIGHIVYPAGGEVKRHIHLPVERQIVGTSEVIIVQKGSCEVDIYSPDKELVATKTLNQGDILVTLAGGHAFRMLEDTILLEIKQGPYLESQDKERF